jgi:RNA polymerase sigma factor (sigma-70 family)
MQPSSQVAGLVSQATNGDKQAWDALVERYAPLIWSMCRRYQLSRTDAEDVGQDVWLTLAGHLGNLRDPAALPGWLATTIARECAKARRAARRRPAAGHLLETDIIPDTQAETAEQELLAAERHAALREALTCLPPRGQQLLTLLSQDPPVSYVQISAALGIPVGSIGPLRSRYLHKLRSHPALAALINADTASAPVG